MDLNVLNLFRLAVLAFLCSPVCVCAWMSVTPAAPTDGLSSETCSGILSSHLFGCAASAPESFPALPASSSTTYRKENQKDNLNKGDKGR